ncbi:hypothetical protein DBR44_18890 [Aquitalea sp. FJL05]|nr:hypothetical protein DBR44_18890 [Aquitalea sp. FJL05]
MAAHLGHYKHESMFNPDGDTRNSKSSKPLKGDFSELHIEVPRDRQGTLRATTHPQASEPLDRI